VIVAFNVDKFDPLPGAVFAAAAAAAAAEYTYALSCCQPFMKSTFPAYPEVSSFT